MAKADGRIIGWGGLYQDPFDPGWGVEVGYSFHPAAWGRGYASELTATCTEIADNVLRLPEVRAFAHRDNLASRRVLEKASRWCGSSPRWGACSIDVPAARRGKPPHDCGS